MPTPTIAGKDQRTGRSMISTSAGCAVLQCAPLTVRAAPHIKGWIDGLRSRLSGEAGNQPALDSDAETGLPQQAELALEDLRAGVSGEEAQRRIAMIMIGAAFIADQIRALSHARVEDAEAPRELRTAFRLTSGGD